MVTSLSDVKPHGGQVSAIRSAAFGPEAVATCSLAPITSLELKMVGFKGSCIT